MPLRQHKQIWQSLEDGAGKRCRAECGQCHGLCLVTENGATRVRESPTVTSSRGGSIGPLRVLSGSRLGSVRCKRNEGKMICNCFLPFASYFAFSSFLHINAVIEIQLRYNKIHIYRY